MHILSKSGRFKSFEISRQKMFTHLFLKTPNLFPWNFPTIIPKVSELSQTTVMFLVINSLELDNLSLHLKLLELPFPFQFRFFFLVKCSENMNNNEFLPGRYTDLTFEAESGSIHSATDCNSEDFFRGFHL